MIHFIQTPSAEQSAETLAQAVAQNLRDALAKQDRATLAVSGGKSPIAFFQALNQIELDWARVNITLVDERLVPTQHTDSNTGLVRQYLLQNKAQAAKWLPVVSDEATESSLKNTSEAVAFALQHYVQPDVLILGMGGDGHTASIFPQAPQFADAVRADYPQPLLRTTPVTAPHERVSMTLAAIEATKHVYLSIAGAAKREVYDQAAQAAVQQFPVSYVLNSQKVETHVIYND
ncbi:6-phosphogluconolactonase [Kingella negevensis]|uniref:6-phosphogluconolactonase n=1 Tax=Kingella negevensis TaxID=1522312 RepID=UPI002543E8E5|nr:6-phosphogluconolactonase [Kingella negevensis]WII93875.1 6-phosphogluconolactonase [Kingella negevensis]